MDKSPGSEVETLCRVLDPRADGGGTVETVGVGRASGLTADGTFWEEVGGASWCLTSGTVGSASGLTADDALPEDRAAATRSYFSALIENALLLDSGNVLRCSSTSA